MRASAELYAVAAHIYDTNDISVFFSEESHSSHLSGVLDAFLAYCYGEAFEYLFVYDVLNLLYFLGSHSGKVSEVKTEPVGRHIRTGLFNVSTKNGTKRFLKKVGSGVVP